MRILTAVLIAAAVPAGRAGAAPPVPRRRAASWPGPGTRRAASTGWLLGPTYRDLWTTPIEVEVLDLATYAGGLTATKKGGGMQTKTLRFEAADGRRFRVRSVDKDPTPDAAARPARHLRGVGGAGPDQHRASRRADRSWTAWPTPPASATSITASWSSPTTRGWASSARTSAACSGIIEEEIRIEPPVTRGFEDVEKTVEGDEMNKLADAGAADRVDARALLKARLFDMFIGDWDRHIGQWDWARVKGSDKWQPIPSDRDQAFAKFDGLVLGLARASQPRFVNFEKEYPVHRRDRLERAPRRSPLPRRAGPARLPRGRATSCRGR